MPGGRPPTDAAWRRTVLTELREINKTQRYLVGMWATPRELPENDPKALDILIRRLSDVIERAAWLKAQARDRVNELKRNAKGQEAMR